MVSFLKSWASSPFLFRNTCNFRWFNPFNPTGAAHAAATATGAMVQQLEAPAFLAESHPKFFVKDLLHSCSYTDTHTQIYIYIYVYDYIYTYIVILK